MNEKCENICVEALSALINVSGKKNIIMFDCHESKGVESPYDMSRIYV